MTTAQITILMATRNGARFLPAQLDSLLAQQHDNWSLLVSDDGSCDGTQAILHAFDQAHPGRIIGIRQGPKSGSAAQNFLSLLTSCHVPKGLVALADQDDVWLSHKLSRAIEFLGRVPENVPAIYAAESILTDENLRPIGRSREASAIPAFHNALVQNLFAGHSIVLNGAALALVQRAGAPRHIAFHDWWLYQLVAGAGGQCLLDAAQTVLYRQHGCNVFGGAFGINSALARLRYLLRNDYAGWLRAHWLALQDVSPLLTPDARDLVADLLQIQSRETRAAQLRRLNLRRSTRRGTAALWLAAGLGRV